MEQSILILQGTPNGIGPLIMLPLIFAIFYFLVFMPMKKRQKKVEAMITALKNGDRVITTSGIYGVVSGIKDKTFIIKIADQIKIEVAKNAIASLQEPEEK